MGEGNRGKDGRREEREGDKARGGEFRLTEIEVEEGDERKGGRGGGRWGGRGRGGEERIGEKATEG